MMATARRCNQEVLQFQQGTTLKRRNDTVPHRIFHASSETVHAQKAGWRRAVASTFSRTILTNTAKGTAVVPPTPEPKEYEVTRSRTRRYAESAACPAVFDVVAHLLVDGEWPRSAVRLGLATTEDVGGIIANTDPMYGT